MWLLQSTNVLIGNSKKKVANVPLSIESSGTINCLSCKWYLIIYAHCKAQVYYLLPKDTRYTHLVIHQGHKEHDMQRGASRIMLYHIMGCSPQNKENMGPRKIQMELMSSKVYFSKVPCALMFTVHV